MSLVLDASVLLKWLLNNPEREAETEEAIALMEKVIHDKVPVLQPFHWMAEVGAVLARLSPNTAEDDLVMVQALGLPVVDDPAILRRACRLAIETEHHLFDTLYHAVALETPDTVLITADKKHLDKAQQLGCIIHLKDWRTVLARD